MATTMVWSMWKIFETTNIWKKKTYALKVSCSSLLPPVSSASIKALLEAKHHAEYLDYYEGPVLWKKRKGCRIIFPFVTLQTDFLIFFLCPISVLIQGQTSCSLISHGFHGWKLRREGFDNLSQNATCVKPADMTSIIVYYTGYVLIFVNIYIYIYVFTLS